MALLRSDIHSKIASLRQRLEEIREYKRILSEDGLKPDAADKVLESELIQKLLGLEKDLARMDAIKGRRGAQAAGDPKSSVKKFGGKKFGGKKFGGKNVGDPKVGDKKPRGEKPGAKKRGMLDGVKKDFSKVKDKTPDLGSTPPRGKSFGRRRADEGESLRSEKSRDGRPPKARDGRPPKARDGRPPKARDGRPPKARDGRPPKGKAQGGPKGSGPNGRAPAAGEQRGAAKKPKRPKPKAKKG